jgi:hypothetical protein
MVRFFILISGLLVMLVMGSKWWSSSLVIYNRWMTAKGDG